MKVISHSSGKGELWSKRASISFRFQEPRQEAAVGEIRPRAASKDSSRWYKRLLASERHLTSKCRWTRPWTGLGHRFNPNFCSGIRRSLALDDTKPSDSSDAGQEMINGQQKWGVAHVLRVCARASDRNSVKSLAYMFLLEKKGKRPREPLFSTDKQAA